METIFRWSGEPPKYDKEELCTLELHHHFGMLENDVYKGGKKIGIDLGYKVDITQRVTSLKVYYKGLAKSSQHVVNEVLVLYYYDPTHNNKLESEDKGQQQHSEDDEEEEEEEKEKEEKEEKEYVIVDSDYEISEEEENGNKEAASSGQHRKDAPNDEYAQCFEEMNEMPLNEATGEISDDDEDSDQLPSDVDNSGDEEEGQKKTSKRKWKRTNFKQFRKETDLRNPEFRIGMQFANKDELKEAIKEYAIMQGRNIKLVKNDNRRIQAKCVGHTKCLFILWASKIDRDEQTFSIKTLSLEHECTRVDKLKYTNSRWLSKRFADKIRKNPEWDVEAFKAEAHPNQPNPTRGRGRGRGTTTGRGRGEMPTGRGNVGNGTTEMPNNFSSSQPLPSSSQPLVISSQPLSYTRATSSSSRPPKSPAKRFKSPAKRVKGPARRFKCPAMKLKPWMF
ncbi:unnamed protein product [Prunus armeniaca]